MASKNNTEQEQSLNRFRWVIGTPYFVQGTSTLVEVPILYFIKFVLEMGDAGGQLFDALRQAGWFIKPLWGFISDRIRLFGYHRKSWYVLMASLATVFWALNALLAFMGISIPMVYLLTFNLAFGTYAFVDVVCDALMVTRGRQLGRVGSFINYQWAVLGIANAGSVLLGGWFQGRIQEGRLEPWLVFLLTGIPPLVTVIVGVRNIEEKRADNEAHRHRSLNGQLRSAGFYGKVFLRWLRELPAAFRRFRRQSRHIWLLVLFIFFWKFSPSVGYIERSYLIDVRGFTPESFGMILAAGGISFLASVLTYRWFVRQFSGIRWHQYLYAMVGLGVIAFPLSFFLYLDPGHPWWALFDFALPGWLNPLPEWNRYQWFRLIIQTTLGFATIPAFIVPLTIAGETINVAYAGLSYAFLMSLANATNMFEGVVGAGLYDVFTRPAFDPMIGGFQDTVFNIAGSSDERTLVLQLFVYISLFFTLLTIPFIELLRRELNRRNISVHLGKRPGN